MPQMLHEKVFSVHRKGIAASLGALAVVLSPLALSGIHGSGVRVAEESSAKGIHGSGARGTGDSLVNGIHDSSVRETSGSTTTGIHGSGVRITGAETVAGIHGSGVREIVGDAVLGIHGSDIRGIGGSGVRLDSQSDSEVEGIHGSGNRGIHGSGARGINGSGVRDIQGSNIQGIHGSGVRGIHGSGVRGIHGSGIRVADNPTDTVDSSAQSFESPFSLAALGPVESIGQNADGTMTVVIFGQTFSGDLASGLTVGDYVFAGSLGDGTLDVLVPVGSDYLLGASDVGVIGTIDVVDSQIGQFAIGSTTFDFSGLLSEFSEFSPEAGDFVEVTGNRSSMDGPVMLGIHGSGVRGIHGSGVRGIHGSGVRGIHGSGAR